MSPVLYNAILNLKSLIDKTPNKDVITDNVGSVKYAKWGKLTAYNIKPDSWSVSGAGKNEILDGMQKRILHTISDLGQDYQIDDFKLPREKNGSILIYNFKLVDKNIAYKVSIGIQRRNYLYETFLVVEKL